MKTQIKKMILKKKLSFTKHLIIHDFSKAKQRFCRGGGGSILQFIKVTAFADFPIRMILMGITEIMS